MTKCKTKRKTSKNRKIRKISHLRKPEDMPLEQWQIALRKQFAQKRNFRLKNSGDEPIFSEFIVTNPETGGEYRVAIRGQKIGDNYCSCPDFAVNTLGTCKHIEFTLGKLQRKLGGKKAFAEGFQPVYSEIYLRYGAKRKVTFSPGTKCPKSLLELASRYFDNYGILKPQGYLRFDTFMSKAGAFKHDLRCYEDTIEFIAQVRDQAHLKKRIEKAFPSSTNSAAFRKLLKGQLYPYQRKGALFAAKAGRSLIADDMGLGKTIEAIAAVEILAGTVSLERVLIISPTSLKHHEENRETVARIVAKWRRLGFLSETDQRILMIALQNMRMSCNSTYLLDKKTDYGIKADELISVLEQRIGRIHRLGQHRPVRVVNFVVQGTIEHGMLSLLSFKQSLFSGVLDKGKDEVLLGGTRLKRFMDSVDNATSAIPESMPQQAKAGGDGDGIEQEVSVETKEKEISETVQQQAWDDLVSTGLSFLDKLGRTLLGEEDQPQLPGSKASSGLKIETDKATGQRHLKLPIPKKEVLQDIANLLNEFSKKI